LEPGQPIPVTCPARSEAIDALLGTKGGSPRVVPDETKLAITNCASRGSATSKTFGAVQHCSLLLVLSWLFVDHLSFTAALHAPVRFSNLSSLRRSRSPAQLNVGSRWASRVVIGTIRKFYGARKPATSRCETSISSTVQAIVLLSQGIVHTPSNLGHSRPV
jgi:hypothetical protein